MRAVGVTIVEASTPEELALAIGPKTAMIYFFTTPGNETGPMSLEAIARIATPHGVPIMVDAAAEILTVPNVHLQRGATLVGYSGGKILRGPQTAGVLLGRKDLVQAAWMHSAPHHGYARAMKVGREEVVAMLVAVERWVKGDRAAEWAEWVRGLVGQSALATEHTDTAGGWPRNLRRRCVIGDGGGLSRVLPWRPDRARLRRAAATTPRRGRASAHRS